MAKRAKRRPACRLEGPCRCVVCVERTQLYNAAAWHPNLGVRIGALTFLGAMGAVYEGRCGAVTVEELFD